MLVIVAAGLAFLLLRPEEKQVTAPAETNTNIVFTNLQAGGTNIGLTNGASSGNDEDRVVGLIEQGNQLLAQEKFLEASEKFEQAVAISPDQEDLHYNLAIALAKAGKRDEAKKHYEEALRIFPEYAEALNNLGNLLMAESKFDEAIGRFTEAIKHAPSNASYHNNLGTAYARQRKLAEATLEFEQAVKLDPNYVEARVNLANNYLTLGRMSEGINQLNEALRLRPNYPPALQLLQRVGKNSAKP
jgi:tetratricopeptide (TPR) repeat protein